MKNLRILVPLDFSDLGNQALAAARTFVTIFGGRITPFHAYIPITDLDGFYYMGTGFSAQDNFTEVEKVLLDRLNETAQKHVDQSLLAPAVIDVGNPAQAICHAADDYDMIVMGTHGRTGFSRFFMGSVTDKVLRICQKPVLVIEEHSELDEIKSILVTTDFSENSTMAFPLALDIAKGSAGRIDLVHIVSKEALGYGDDDEAANHTASARDKELDEMIDTYFSEIKDRVQAKTLVSDKSPHEAIAEINKTGNYNLIVMSTVGRTGLEYLRMGSTTSNVARHVETAVLGVNPEAKREG
ncbi:MAG: universal stress protein [Balneolales bacterium]